MKGLRYVTDQSPGISRHRSGGRRARPAFTYRSASGQPVRARATLERIRALAIPPAYEDVWICPNPHGHLQATGRDARGRKQYRYHPQWRANKDEIKHARMRQFGQSLPRLRRILRRDLARSGLPREKVLALVLSLMDATSVRIGNAEYARSNGSFGLSTLRDRHARFSRNGALTLHFPGKGGAIHDVHVKNPRLSMLVKKCQHLPGQRLFQYLDAEGRRHAVDSGQVNDYLRSHLGGEYSAKDFRTWHATLRAWELLRKLPLPQPPTERACRMAINAVIQQVAADLRNTPTVCRKSYINPLVFDVWRDGRRERARSRRGGSPAALLSLLGTARAM